MQKNIGVQKNGPVPRHVQPFSFHLRKKEGARTGSGAAGGERVAANFKKSHFP